jgi:hypothetical protein
MSRPIGYQASLTTTNPSILKAIQLSNPNTISRLEEFYNKSSRLESEYKADALTFIEDTLRIQSGGETKRDLTLLLLGLGFKKANVSKMIEATRFTLQLEREKSDAADWVKSLPVSTQYVLSSCEDKTFQQVWANESEWGEKKLTYQQIADFKAKHEKVSMETPKKFPRETLANACSASATQTDQLSTLLKARDLVKDFPELVVAIDKVINETTSS